MEVCLERSGFGRNFWLREVQEKCLLILTKVAKEESTLDGDVVTASPGLRALPAVGDSSSGPVARDRSPRRPIRGASKDKGGKRDTKHHNLDGDSSAQTGRAKNTSFSVDSVAQQASVTTHAPVIRAVCISALSACRLSMEHLAQRRAAEKPGPPPLRRVRTRGPTADRRIRPATWMPRTWYRICQMWARLQGQSATCQFLSQRFRNQRRRLRSTSSTHFHRCVI